MTIDPNSTLHPAIDTPEVHGGIDLVIDGIRKAQEAIDGVRPPLPERQAESRSLIERFGEARGRGLVFPLMGSGLGRGALVELTDGSVKYDFITGIGVHAFGHGDLDIIRTALMAATGDVVMQGNLHCNREAADFSETLLDAAAGSGELYDTLMFSPSDEIDSYYPLITEKVRYSDDYSWLEISINPAARFHDGEPITAHDVAFTFDKFMTER